MNSLACTQVRRRWLAALAVAFAAGPLAGCGGLNEKQVGAVKAFATATTQISDVVAADVTSLREDLKRFRLQRIAIDAQHRLVGDNEAQRDPAFGLNEFGSLHDAVRAMRDYGQLLQSLATDDTETRLGAAADSLFQSATAAGLELDDAKKSALSKAVQEVLGYYFAYKRKQAIAAAVQLGSPAVGSIVTTLKADYMAGDGDLPAAFGDETQITGLYNFLWQERLMVDRLRQQLYATEPAQPASADDAGDDDTDEEELAWDDPSPHVHPDDRRLALNDLLEGSDDDDALSKFNTGGTVPGGSLAFLPLAAPRLAQLRTQADALAVELAARWDVFVSVRAKVRAAADAVAEADAQLAFAIENEEFQTQDLNAFFTAALDLYKTYRAVR